MSQKNRKHPYLNLKLPHDAPFILKRSSGKGWGLFATRDIKRGTVILREVPVMTWAGPTAESTEFSFVAAEQHFRREFQKLDPATKMQLSCLRYNGNENEPFPTLTEMWNRNKFTRESQGPGVHGLYPLHSRLNHSCLPNVNVSTDGNAESSFATRDITAGEELLFCYEACCASQTVADRHFILQFACNCKVCTPGTETHRLGEVYRSFMKGLVYLLDGTCWDGHKDTSDAPIINDSELKTAAENADLPLSNRLFYYTLYCYLLCLMGLGDDENIGQTLVKMVPVILAFRTDSNNRLVNQFMEESEPFRVSMADWSKGLALTMRLFGRRDAGDAAFNKMLRESRKILKHK